MKKAILRTALISACALLMVSSGALQPTQADVSVPSDRIIIGKWPAPPTVNPSNSPTGSKLDPEAPLDRTEVKLQVPKSDSVMAIAWRKTLLWHKVSSLLFDDEHPWETTPPASFPHSDATAPAAVSEGAPLPEPEMPPVPVAPQVDPPATGTGSGGDSESDAPTPAGPSATPGSGDGTGDGTDAGGGASTAPSVPPSTGGTGNGTGTGTPAGTYEDKPDNTRTGRYVQSLVPYAQEAQRRYGVPASVSIAQAILESGWGDSSLARMGLAQFGIKCTSYMSPYQQGCWNMDTNEFVGGEMVNTVAGFRTYATVHDSVLDHALFLTENSRYAEAFASASSADFARAIAAAGYATDPRYAAKLLEIMAGWDLYRYDVNQDSYAVFTGWVSVTGGIGEYYYNTGAADLIGAPIGDEGNAASSGVRIWTFDHGAILWSQTYGAHAISGGIWEQYRASWALRAKLGAPKGDAHVDGSGRTVQEFVGGVLYA